MSKTASATNERNIFSSTASTVWKYTHQSRGISLDVAFRRFLDNAVNLGILEIKLLGKFVIGNSKIDSTVILPVMIRID